MDVGELFRVRGLTAVVTGGGSGKSTPILLSLPYEVHEALAEAGAHRVYILGRRLEVLQKAAGKIGHDGVVVPLCCDVTSAESLDEAVRRVESDVGYLNLVVCNAGIAGPQVPAPGPNTTIDEFRSQQLAHGVQDFTDTFKANTTSVWYTAMSFLKLLDLGNQKRNVEQTSQVLIVSSIGGFNKKAPGGWAYGASKAGTTHIARMLSHVLPTWDIRVNCLCPGLFPSGMSAPVVESLGGSLDKAGGEHIPVDKGFCPAGRMGDENDMAGQILYLVSRAGAYCNGNIVVCDGGRISMLPSSGY